MKIYFLASLNQKVEFEPIYKKIIDYLNKDGNEIYEKILSQHIPQVDSVPTHKIEEWYREWSEYITECDFVVAEASYPSCVQVGFEIGMLLAHSKPVILLHRANRDPVFINYQYSPRLIKTEYDNENLDEVLDWSIQEVKALSQKRFTFYVTPDIDGYLDRLSKKKDVSKSEIVRALIEKEMIK